MIKIISTVLLSTSILLSSTTVHAQETNPPTNVGGLVSALENLTHSLDLLDALKTSKRPIDTTTLQTAINKVLDLSIVELEHLQTELNGLKNLPEDNQIDRDEYLQQLSQIRLHYEDVRTVANQELTVAETATIGRKLQEYRATAQELINHIVDLITVFQTQDALITARGRLANILKDKDKIQATLSRTKWTTFTQLLKKARLSITHANQFNARAQELLQGTINGYDTGQTIDSLVTTASKDIQDAYNAFLAMSKLIKK